MTKFNDISAPLVIILMIMSLILKVNGVDFDTVPLFIAIVILFVDRMSLLKLIKKLNSKL